MLASFVIQRAANRARIAAPTRTAARYRIVALKGRHAVFRAHPVAQLVQIAVSRGLPVASLVRLAVVISRLNPLGANPAVLRSSP